MATQDTASIETTEHSLRVSDFETADQTIVDYFRELDPADYEGAFEQVLRVGVTTMELAQTSQQEEFVERKFAEMHRDLEEEIDRIESEVEEKFGNEGTVPQIFEDHLGQEGRLEQQIEHAFSEDGPFTERLDEELGENGERIQDALDPDTEGTPTYRLKSALQDQIRSLRDKLEEQAAAEEKAEELRKRTTLKGEDFEETVETILADLVYNTSNELESTGDEIGELTGRKVGDFVVTLNDTGQRVVVEAKSDRNYSQRAVKEELADAIENRDADYGIIVFESEACVPNKVGYFHEFDSERLSVALSGAEEDEVDPALLRIAFNWARTRVIRGYMDAGEGLDPEALQTSIGEVRNGIDRFSTIRKKTTSIRNTAGQIDEELDEIEGEVKSQLADIRAELQAAE